MVETLFFVAVVVLMSIVQFMIMSVMWQRFMQLVRMGQPRTSWATIQAFGPDDEATYQALAKHTHLSIAEIDEILEDKILGRLPIALSAREASVLATALRAAGTEVTIEVRSSTRQKSVVGSR